ncbi:hypothetical protein PGT21_012513 [Puccinia graminis f. sp. tritici]|uniref:Uncharacterized protein n=1 Tax=Puccinia graminis f. sp. tritici TaxID=56615 RepID=A0A5B0LTF5_PUCGR|nr:hypothetical protein PGT21_012513 [Puccinia graminis f. sp. tritici]
MPRREEARRLPPLWEHLTEAAGVEIKLKELAKELESLKQQLESQSPQPELAIDHTEPATEYTEPVTDYTEPATDYMELATDCTEPETDYTELVTDHTEPEANYTEPTIADTEKSMDVTIPVASMNMTEPVTTTELLDLEEWKAASINVMDTPMELAHTVIKIPDIILDEPDTENNVDHEEILDQSTQPETLDHLHNPVKMENLLLAETSKEDHKFPAIPGKFWMLNINKYLEIKIFNKQLFKPLLDIFGLLQINKHMSQHLEIKNTQIEEPECKISRSQAPLAIENVETTDLPTYSQPVTPLISTAQIPEEVFSIPTPPDPPDITTTFTNPQNEANRKTRQLSKLTINNLALSKLPRELFLLFYLLQKICPQLPLSIPPDPL